jgi:hypothetical protein
MAARPEAEYCPILTLVSWSRTFSVLHFEYFRPKWVLFFHCACIIGETNFNPKGAAAWELIYTVFTAPIP